MSRTFYIEEPRRALHGIMRVEPRRKAIGFAAKGWSFAYYGSRRAGIVDVAGWKAHLAAMMEAGGLLVDEYGHFLTLAELDAVIEAHRGGGGWVISDARIWTDTDGNSFSEEVDAD